jgi:hypothetical protein
MNLISKVNKTRLDSNEFKGSLANPYPVRRPPPVTEAVIKETLLALVRDLFTFSSKVIKRFIIV